MALPTIDHHGNLHRPAGTAGAGRFAPQEAAAPSVQLAPSGGNSELRAKFTALWRELREEMQGADEARTGPSTLDAPLRRSVLDVAVRRLTTSDAPVAVEVAGARPGDEVAPQYRVVDGELFRQLFGGAERTPEHESRPALPAPEAPLASGVPASLPLQHPQPVAATEAWLRGTAEAAAHGFTAATPEDVQEHVQRQVDGFASVDGQVWTRAEEPVYRVPVAEPGQAAVDPVAIAVVPAPTDSEHAVRGYFHAEDYDRARDVAAKTARETGSRLDIADDAPIQWLTELGLIERGAWTEGEQLRFTPSAHLAVESFHERFAALRREIVDKLPGAVTGDVPAFVDIPRFALDLSRLTAAQADEYRRYVMFALAHGLI